MLRVFVLLSLLIGNLVPLFGVWALGWSAGALLLVYWLENVAYWLVSVVRIATARGGRSAGGRRAGSAKLAGFFALHYGMFTLVHGVFVMSAFGGWDAMGSDGLHWAVLGLAVAHGLSLAINWFLRGERDRVSPGRAMWTPYPRMLALHVAIIFGAMVVGDEATGALVILAVLKTVGDLGFHTWEHGSAFGERRGPGNVLSSG